MVRFPPGWLTAGWLATGWLATGWLANRFGEPA